MAVVLFCDQVGSTATRTSLGDTAADDLRREADRLIGAAIVGAGGTVVKWLGDGVVATFDAASSAVAAAAGIQRAAAEARRAADLPAPLQVRVGISAGDVGWEDDDCFGTPVVEAARLEAAADAGTILCSEVVRVLAGSRTDFEFRSVGALDLKGLPQPLTACEVVWDRPEDAPAIPLPEPLLRVDRHPFVGRRNERGTLDALLARAVDGELVAALLGGEPGVGKTRLAREMARAAHDAGHLVLHGRCDDAVGIPYEPFVQALRFLLDRDPHASERLGTTPGELARVIPELMHLAPELPPPDEASEVDRYRLFEAFLSWLEEVARDRPVVFLVDDVHWASPPTLDLLRFVVRAHSSARVLLLVTYRNTRDDASRALDKLLAALAREPNVVHLQLEGLDADDIAGLISDQPDQKRLAQRIHEQTGGNAFFVGEIVQELGHLADAGDVLAVPGSVHAVVLDRVRRLSEPTQHLLEVAAVAGHEVEVPVLADAIGVDEREIEPLVEEACRARLLRELPDPPHRCRFEHALVRSTLAEELPPHRRSRHHHAIGAAIERRYAHRLEPHLERLAFHFSRSAAPDAVRRVIRYGGEAADNALSQLAHSQAADHLEVVVGAMRRPDADVADVDLGWTLVRLGTARRRSHHPAANDTLLEAADLAARLGERDLLVAAALANTRTVFWTGEPTDPQRSFAIERALAMLDERDSAERAKLIASLSVERYLAGDEDGHRRLADEALAMARRLDDVTTLAHVHHFRHLSTCRPDALDERVQLAKEMRDAVERSGTGSRFEFGAWAIPAFHAGIEAGDLDVADEALDLLTGLAVEVRDVNLAFNARLAQSVRAGMAGRLDEAERLADEMLTLGIAAGQRTAPVFHIGLRYSTYFHQGRLGELVDTLAYGARQFPAVTALSMGLALALAETHRTDEARDAFALFLATRFSGIAFDRDWTVSMTCAARTACHLADEDAAALVRELLAPYGGQFATNMTVWFGSIDGVVALLDDLLGDHDVADERFTRAVEAHRRVGAPANLALSLVEWGERLAARGEREQARPLLEEARRLAGVRGMTTVADRALAAASTPEDVRR